MNVRRPESNRGWRPAADAWSASPDATTRLRRALFAPGAIPGLEALGPVLEALGPVLAAGRRLAPRLGAFQVLVVEPR